MLDLFLDKEPFSDHRRTLPESLTTRTLEKTEVLTMVISMSPRPLAAVVATLVLLASPLYAQTTETVDIKKEAKDLVTSIRQIIMKAKEGSPLEKILQDVLDLQNVTLNLISKLPTKEISQCETQAVIKTAAAAVRSHEVLGVLLATGTLNVLSARLGLALAMVTQVTQQLEDKLARSSDVGPELSAIIFGTNTTATIINTADEKIKKEIISVEQGNRTKRGAVLPLARGFDFRNHVVIWRDTIGWHTVHVPPYRRHHVYARSPRSGWTGGLSGSGTLKEGDVTGGVEWKSKKGNWDIGAGGGLSWGPDGLKPSVGFKINFKF
ncbi:uncharacterized protein LOC112557397 isoform X2 [Pomacea canaliculata]|nr:uncharacterized protein LOC112557397 isoform X2 [Pomacea canaliculata]XP_025083003.1 uncharacterized protein LOC112557397 isoform X2 [Pomacea canaliculata]XP_025083005.1 uncharacterized protein LOC112557397 isoform X2 [Pomacea canaliculata]